MGCKAVSRKEVLGVFKPGSHGSTFGGNPLACRAGKTVIEVIENEGLVERAKVLGEGLALRFGQLIEEHEMLIDQRGRGLLRGLITPKDFDRGQIVAAAREQGLLITTAGSDALRVCPPLIIGEGHLDEAIEKLDKAIRSLK